MQTFYHPIDIERTWRPDFSFNYCEDFSSQFDNFPRVMDVILSSISLRAHKLMLDLTCAWNYLVIWKAYLVYGLPPLFIGLV
jgi:hypothetical protein